MPHVKPQLVSSPARLDESPFSQSSVLAMSSSSLLSAGNCCSAICIRRSLGVGVMVIFSKNHQSEFTSKPFYVNFPFVPVPIGRFPAQEFIYA